MAIAIVLGADASLFVQPTWLGQDWRSYSHQAPQSASQVFRKQSYTLWMVNGEAWIEAQLAHVNEVYEHLDLHTFPTDHQAFDMEIISIPNT